MDVTTLPSISDWFDGVDQWREVLALLPVLVVLELVLSADNAVALAAIARRCRGQDRERFALNIGIALALVLRIGLILVAQWVLQNPVVQTLAAAYLLWLFLDHVRSRSSDQEGASGSASESAPAPCFGWFFCWPLRTWRSRSIALRRLSPSVINTCW